jgi:hypothetical protein
VTSNLYVVPGSVAIMITCEGMINVMCRYIIIGSVQPYKTVLMSRITDVIMERMLIDFGAVKMCATGLVLIFSLFNCIIMNVHFLLPPCILINVSTYLKVFLKLITSLYLFL